MAPLEFGPGEAIDDIGADTDEGSDDAPVIDAFEDEEGKETGTEEPAEALRKAGDSPEKADTATPANVSGTSAAEAEREDESQSDYVDQDNDTPDEASGGDGGPVGTRPPSSKDTGSGGQSTGGTGHAGSRPRSGPASSSSSKQGQFITYVAREDGDASPGSSDAQQTRDVVEQAAVELVMDYEREHHRYPEEMPKGHPGYDIESKEADGEIVRFIEVKGTGKPWGEAGVGLTNTEYDKARELREDYWLYVVERAGEKDQALYRINDPAGLVNRYFYDYGWRKLAED